MLAQLPAEKAHGHRSVWSSALRVLLLQDRTNGLVACVSP
jgi:hypothetical protein